MHKASRSYFREAQSGVPASVAFPPAVLLLPSGSPQMVSHSLPLGLAMTPCLFFSAVHSPFDSRSLLSAVQLPHHRLPWRPSSPPMALVGPDVDLGSTGSPIPLQHKMKPPLKYCFNTVRLPLQEWHILAIGNIRNAVSLPRARETTYCFTSRLLRCA